jgi:hypothetical protein
MNIRSAVHEFYDLETSKFSPERYSQLKFGSDSVAWAFGVELAEDTFEKYADVLLANRVVVIPSPYNHVENAATIMTGHFVNRLNHLLVQSNGSHVEYSVIHRKVSYINDYGFLSKEKRRGLIDNDSFYLNKDFYKDKLLIFVDDVRITGTHEDKLQQILEREGIKNRRMYLYYADYKGDNPTVEAQINFAGVRNVQDYLELAGEPGHHVIVRPIKYLLSLKEEEFDFAMNSLPFRKKQEIYHGALGEGYYKVPAYQINFNKLKKLAT